MPEARLTKETMTISKKIMPWRPESERKKSSTRRVSAAVINTPAYSGNLGKRLGTGVVSRASDCRVKYVKPDSQIQGNRRTNQLCQVCSDDGYFGESVEGIQSAA